MSTELHTLTLPRARLRRTVARILSLAPKSKDNNFPKNPIRVICISDTHNHQPDLPSGDLLLHAGDLSEWGSSDEIQAQLSWISSQPHKHKVVIVGNHDVLFDQKFLDSHKERFPAEVGKTWRDLDFASVIYLQDSSTTLDFPEHGRSISVYCSPWTPKYGDSAFQHPRDEDIWSRDLPRMDVLLTHGPPYRHLDGALHSGSQYLARFVERQRPRLVVFGHMHVAYGRETVTFDRLRRMYENIERGWSGWEVIPAMGLLLLWSSIRSVFRFRTTGHLTELINAAVVGMDGKLCNEAQVAWI